MAAKTKSPQRRINALKSPSILLRHDVLGSLLTGSEPTGVGESASKLTGVGGSASVWLPPNAVSVSLLTGSESTGVGESASELTSVGGSTAWLPPNGVPQCWQNLALSATWVPQ